MKKIINTFKYGSSQVKLVLFFTIFAGMGTLGFGIAAIIMKQMMFFFAAVIGTFTTLSLMQTFVIKGDAESNKENNKENYKFDSKESSKETSKEISKEVSKKKLKEISEDKSKKTTKNLKTKKKGSKKDSKKERTKTKKEKNPKKGAFFQVSEEADAYADEMDELLSRIESSLESAGNSATKELDEAQTDDFEINTLETLVPVQATEDVFASYNKKKIKKTMHKYKVKRDHRLIMIDRSEKLQIHQSPAYMWVADKELHFLLIEKEPRHIAIPEFQFREVTYLKKQKVNEDIDYGAFKGSNMLSDLFRPYLPDYTHSTVVDDLSAYKNLYGLGNDIFVTNRSASALFDLLAVEFCVDDKVTTSTKVNIFFKEAYKANIMLRDNVIDANGYADKISSVLNNLAHSTISYAEFKDTLNLMIKNKLITQEFAMYYMDVRNKL